MDRSRGRGVHWWVGGDVEVARRFGSLLALVGDLLPRRSTVVRAKHATVGGFDSFIIMSDEKAQAYVLHFLQHGCFTSDLARRPIERLP